jgi:uncharacterized protein (UPF0335 family)
LNIASVSKEIKRVDNEQSSMAFDRKSTWEKTLSKMNSTSSVVFMEIRFRSLGKALDEIRTKRVHLDEDLRNGHVDQSDYASQLLNLIVQTNNLDQERKEIEDRVKQMRSNRLS